jgi:molybdopterin-guanine dinucleotide biosynthesis protein B
MLRAVVVSGFKKSGKTAVVEGLVRELVKRGYHVGTIKHIREKEFSMDSPGKDTWRHAKAGASVVVSLAPREVATIKKGPGNIDEIMLTFQQLDLVILEGFRESKGMAKIIVPRNASEVSKLVDKFTIACVGYGKRGMPVLKLGQVKELADVVEKKALPVLPELDCQSCGYKSCEEFGLAVLSGLARMEDCPPMQERVTLRVDGKVIPLTPFVQDLIANTFGGIISSLKGSKGEEFELMVRKHARYVWTAADRSENFRDKQM